MNGKFFKDTVTLFLFNQDSQEFDKVIIENVYFRHSIATRMTEEGIQRVSSGSITIPSQYAKIGNSLAIYTYNQSNTNILDFVLEGLLSDKMWSLKDNSYVVNGKVNEDFTGYADLVSKYDVFRITSVADNRKGGLQHLKIEVDV